MFSFLKKKITRQSSAQATDVVYKELTPEPAAIQDQAPGTQSAEHALQLLVRLAMTQLALGKTAEEVALLIKNQGASEDVASLIVAKAKEIRLAS